MNFESEEGQAVLGREAQQSIASATTHARSDNDEAESQSDTEEECINFLPESEIQEMAMFQCWHMQQVEHNEAEDFHPQYSVPEVEGPEAVATVTNPDSQNLSTARHAWQHLLSGQGNPRTTPLTHSTRVDNECWGDKCEDKEGDHLRLYVQNEQS